MDELELSPNAEEALQRKRIILAAAQEIHQEGEDFISLVEEFIEYSNGDLKLVIDDLKRLGNFLEAVIEAHPITYKLSEVMKKLALDEATLRQLLVDVGVALDTDVTNPAELVTYHDLVALLADRAGSKEGDLLADLLRSDSPRIVCT